MNGLLIYPFCKEFVEFARNREALKEFDHLILISPKSFGLIGEDASICDGGDPLNITISCDFSSGMEQADAIFFGYVESNISEQHYLEKIRTALEYKKKVYITKELMMYLGDFDGYSQTEILEYNHEMFIDELTERLLPIPVPVIVVFGIGNQCNKFSMQLKLKDYFQKQGYRIMCFGSKPFSKLFGIESLPQFLFDDMNNGMKIQQFNAYIYHRVKRENPDAVIISIPGGIMQVNPYIFHEFGESAFIISNALKADISILSVYNQDLSDEFMDKLLNLCKYRYNFQVGYINIANTSYYISSEDKKERLTTVSSQHIVKEVLKELHHDDVFYFNALNEASMKDACDRICKELENNI